MFAVQVYNSFYFLSEIKRLLFYNSAERQLSHKQHKFLLGAAKSQANKLKQLNYKAVLAAQVLKTYPSKHAEENILLFHNYLEFYIDKKRFSVISFSKVTI